MGNRKSFERKNSQNDDVTLRYSMDKTSWFQARVLKSASILLAIEMTTHDLDTIFPLAVDLLNIQFKTQLLEPSSISQFHNHDMHSS